MRNRPHPIGVRVPGDDPTATRRDVVGDKPSEQRGVTEDGSAEVVAVTIDAAGDSYRKVTASLDHGRIAVQGRHDHGDGVLAGDPAGCGNPREHAGGPNETRKPRKGPREHSGGRGYRGHRRIPLFASPPTLKARLAGPTKPNKWG